MFVEKYGKQVDALRNEFAGRDRGETIQWMEIESIIGFSRDDRGGRVIVKRFRSHLLRDRNIVTIVDPDVGVRMLTHEQAATEVPAMRQRRAYRQINRALNETAAVDTAHLNAFQATHLAASRRRMREQRLELGRGKRESEALMKPTGAVQPR